MECSARNIIACFALLVSISALQVPSCVDQSAGSTAAAGTASVSASAPPPLTLHDGALKAALALAVMDALLIAAAVIHRHHTHHAAGTVGAGGGNWRVTELALAFFVLCLQVGVLQFVQEPAAVGHAAARALGTSATRALPCVASVTFFLGITLIYAQVAGNGGGADDVAGNGPVPAPATVRLLADMSLGAALVCLMSIILSLLYNNTNAQVTTEA